MSDTLIEPILLMSLQPEPQQIMYPSSVRGRRSLTSAARRVASWRKWPLCLTATRSHPTRRRRRRPMSSPRASRTYLGCRAGGRDMSVFVCACVTCHMCVCAGVLPLCMIFRLPSCMNPVYVYTYIYIYVYN